MTTFKTLSSWQKNVGAFLLSQFLTGITSMTVQYSIIWYLTEQTHSAKVLSYATLIGMLPMILLSPFAGTYVDRWNKKLLLIVPDVVAAVVAAGLSIVILITGHVSIWVVYLALFIRAVAQTFQMPTIQSIIPTITPEAHLTKVNGQFGMIQSANMIVAPALGAFLFTIVSVQYLLLLDVLGAVLGICMLQFVKIPKVDATAKNEVAKAHPVKTVVSDMLTGVQLLTKNKGLWISLVIGSISTLFIMPIASLYPLMTLDYFKASIGQVGLVEVCYSVGMLTGGLIISVFGNWKNRMIPFMLSYISLGIVMILSGSLQPSKFGFMLFVGLTFITGVGVPFFDTLLMAMIQQSYENENLGKVMGVTMSILSLPGPIGLIVFGPLADTVGVNRVFLICGIAVFLCAPVNWAFKSAREYDVTLQSNKKTSNTKT
ncbi:MFS transporter [Weissella viridescens]|uniref:MFS transporter n=1 Tax=Weissella viridescens TaxID=1629 RepID=UPI001D085DFB|nr:MFS transporter [Weissella viridescens]MCB6839473.1 MFS transporter [Weissella viridescens]MCB6846204.1 MFS transporter [Weissella viridescens]